MWCPRGSRRPLLGLVLTFLFGNLAQVTLSASTGSAGGYFGKFLGKLNTLHHSVSGDVYAVDSKTLHIRDFTYDGEGPDAFFYAGTTKSPSGSGFRLRDEKGTLNVLGKYKKKHITLTLPEGKTLANIRWFSVWCREFEVNFADVRIPPGFDFPKPIKIGAINAGIHGVKSDPITIVDAQTLLVPNFSYDGEAPDAKFWVGRGEKPDSQGIRVADENGRLGTPLRRYDRRTLVLTLPGDLTVFDIGHFGVWCEAFAVDFGHVTIPKGPPPPNVPPSLRMLGVSPQSKLNCEVLSDEDGFEVRWAVAGHSLVMQLVAKLDNGEYMSFGVSGEGKRSSMVGGDVAVAWLDNETFQGRVDDYFLDAKSQCSGSRGSCPDTKLQEGTESARLLSAARSDGHTVITYQRPLQAADQLDRQIFTNGTKQAFIWAIGPLNARNEVSYHRIANRHDVILDFGRYPEWNCPKSESAVSGSSDDAPKDESHRPQNSQEVEETEEVAGLAVAQEAQEEPIQRPSEVQTPRPVPKVNAWKIPPIPCHEPDDGVYYAQMGPTGGKRGYPAITGHVGWGISWYINGLLIPEINVVRGRTYTFVVEGGADPETPARYHPLYITDDPIGGYQYKTETERAGVQVYAGVEWDPETGEPSPTALGRLCNWTPDPDKPADEATSFGAYQRTLSLVCDEQNEGRPGILRWTPDINTPDTVYYQCYTHRYLGWKINVLDSCESEEGRSHASTHRQRRPGGRRGRGGRGRASEDSSRFDSSESLVPRASIQVSTRVRPEGGKIEEGKRSKPAELSRYVEIVRNHSEGKQETHRETVLGDETLEVDLVAPPAATVTETILIPNERKNKRPSDTQTRRFQPGSSYSLTKRFRPNVNNQALNNDRRVTTNPRGASASSRTTLTGRREHGNGEEASRRRDGVYNHAVTENGFRPVSGNSEPIDNVSAPKVAPRRTPHPVFFANGGKIKKKKTDARQVTENLEPMFIPSPPDLIGQNGTSIRREDDDVVLLSEKMEANERVDSYSLPPKSPQRSSSAVVSYDGKQIDPALTSVVPSERYDTESRSHKRVSSTARIQNTPQFGPFLGEVPPPVPSDVVPASLPQLRSSNSAAKNVGENIKQPPSLDSVNPRDSRYSTIGDIPDLEGDKAKNARSYLTRPYKFGPEGVVRKPGSVRSNDRERRTGSTRDKREAHHEPGHTEDPSMHDHHHHGHDENHLTMNSEHNKCEGKGCQDSSSAFSANADILMLILTFLVYSRL